MKYLVNDPKSGLFTTCVRRVDAFASANVLKVLMEVTLLSPTSMRVKDRNPGTWLRRGTKRSARAG